MFDRKVLKRNLVILILVIAIGLATYGIVRTLARYTSSANTENNVDIAFWFVDAGYQEGIIFLQDIAPSSNFYEYSFSISNTDENNNIAETDLKYEIDIISTTNLPLNYNLYKKVSSVIGIDPEEIYTDLNGNNYREIPFEYSESATNLRNYYTFTQDTDGTYYKNTVFFKDADSNDLSMQYNVETTDEFLILVEFPISYKTESKYQDLVEYIRLGIEAKQIIDE